MTNSLHLFYIDSAESKNCAFWKRRDREKRLNRDFGGLHTPWCHAEREKKHCQEQTGGDASSSGTYSATLEAIKFDILKFLSVFSIYIYWPK